MKPKVIVVMPAYNAAKTIKRTVAEIPKGLVSEIIVVDDGSTDDTVKVARRLGLTVFGQAAVRHMRANNPPADFESSSRRVSAASALATS